MSETTLTKDEREALNARLGKWFKSENRLEAIMRRDIGPAVERIVAAHVHQVEAERDEAIAQSQRALQQAHVAEFQTAALVARVQELADEWEWRPSGSMLLGGYSGCSIGADTAAQCLRSLLAATDTTALDRLLAEAKAEALREAADALDRWQSAEAHIGDPACEGPRGASAAYQCYLDALEVPQDWLRERADRIVREGGEDHGSIVCRDYPNCSREHAGGAGGVPVHPPAGSRVSGCDGPLLPDQDADQ